MSEAVSLLAELFLIGCLYLIMNMLIDKDKAPFFEQFTRMACYAGALFVVARFVVANLLPQMGQIFRMVL